MNGSNKKVFSLTKFIKLPYTPLGDGVTFFTMIPGEYILAKADIEINVGRKTATVTVINTGDRPVQVGSHFHFYEVNSQMKFEREKTLGMRLNIAAGTAIRFEPGEEKTVELVSFGGNKILMGFNNLTNRKVE